MVVSAFINKVRSLHSKWFKTFLSDNATRIEALVLLIKCVSAVYLAILPCRLLVAILPWFTIYDFITTITI